jgi:hypothetical protein
MRSEFMKTAILACAASLFRQPSVARRVARIDKLRRYQQSSTKKVRPVLLSPKLNAAK